MWQFMVAVAVAGCSAFVAKHFFDHHHSKQDTIESPFATPVIADTDTDFEVQCKEVFFRFSSSCTGSRSASGNKKNRTSKKKSAIKGLKLKFDSENDQRSNPKFTVPLKKRRISTKSVTSSAKCRSSSSKDKTLFGWGLGVGMMCMMSAGKTEISKLSNAMDETSKVVQELRSELYKRKSASSSSSKDSNPKDIKVVGRVSMIEKDVECPSSVLTEEADPQILEMDELEAELASELQKLSWSNADNFGCEEVGTSKVKNEAPSDRILNLEGQSNVCYQDQGVSPFELDRKLCHLLIEQQENQIVELESELHMAQSKLNEKGAELQALKDCAKRLTEFSL